MRVLIVLLLAGLLSGCGASYTYKHYADGSCELSILSGREIQAGALSIGSDCNLQGGADSMTNNEKAFDAITSLINKIP